MVLTFLLSTSLFRRSAAFTTTLQQQVSSHRHHGRRPTAGGVVQWLASSSYSATTMRRTAGKNRELELSKMAQQMKLDEPKLKELLSNNLSRMTPGSEKAEYVHWLLSSSSETNPADAVRTERIPKTPTVTAVQPTAPASNNNKQTFSTNVLFADRPDLHPLSKHAVADMGLSSMTEIQERTFAAASTGRDVLGRARTGTGKTVAFLLPAIERIVAADEDVYRTGQAVGILVVSPTRELATQIGDQAKKLLQYHRGTSVQVMFGGTSKQRDENQLQRNLPTVLVATPGRLLDHLASTRLKGGPSFGTIMSKTPLVVLDETDRLLDMGFRKEISKILGYLPPREKRQTLLFSATIPPELKTIMSQNMRKDYIEVDCINDGDAASHTNEQVDQSHVIIPSSDRFVSSVVEIVQQAMHDKSTGAAKIVVFFPTARMVAYFAQLFSSGLQIPVLELHSKKSQSYRDRMSKEFRAAQSGILFTSDVSARGVDYPNVSKVIQFGLPESREQYIHRLGRTGRGGSDGTGLLVLSTWESHFLAELKGLKIPLDAPIQKLLDSPMPANIERDLEAVKTRVRNGDQVLNKGASGAYQAFLGFYKGQMKRMKMKKAEELVSIANQFAAATGLPEPPMLSTQLVGKMGLKGVSGLNVSASLNRGGGRQNGNRGSHGRNSR